MKINKRAQISDTMVWVVATVIIIFILALSIFATSVSLGGGKEIKKKPISDIVATKSLSSYLLTLNPMSNKIVYDELKTKKDFNSFNGELAKNIFLEFYEKEYSPKHLLSKQGLLEGEIYRKGVWLGFNLEDSDKDNNYFGDRPSVYRVPIYALPLLAVQSATGIAGAAAIINLENHVLRRIQLNENEYLDLLLMEEKDE